MNDAVKHRSPPGPLREAPLPSVAGRPVFKANTSQPGGLNKQQMLLLVAVSALIHGGAWWFFQQARAEPLPTPPEIPEMTVELTSPTPPAPPTPEPP
ncbi:energy transducer TonB, partial [Pseudomonas sp. FW305-BF6]